MHLLSNKQPITGNLTKVLTYNNIITFLVESCNFCNMCIFCSNLYSICISVNPALSLSVCLFVCVSACLFLCLRSSTDLFLSLSVRSQQFTTIFFPLSRMCPLKDHHDNIDYQTAYVADLVKETNYGFDLDSSKFFHAWYKSKLAMQTS